MAKNFLELPKIKVPLILGIWGGKGQGKTFQVRLLAGGVVIMLPKLCVAARSDVADADGRTFDMAVALHFWHRCTSLGLLGGEHPSSAVQKSLQHARVQQRRI